MSHLLSHPTLDFGSGHGLVVHGFEPLHAVGVEPAWDSLSSSLSAPPPNK